MGRDSDEWRDADFEEQRTWFEEKTFGTDHVTLVPQSIPQNRYEPCPLRTEFKTRAEYMKAAMEWIDRTFPKGATK